ncbi:MULTISPECIES: 50S ribosomal protein L25/general stress protein Ctc [Sulfurovum]|uniref:50S ribosomal protein L25 n=1 Tax=Sulfurovum xiamenensis TaxID=3019066 RepID=A0ABT7QPK8_9BACT|nr:MULTISPECIES: 50S ribosomal protein L25/general stress protein Ctc [Sulfurovum]EIF51092.1 50S ribosomal protein L25/general stress protein Ctc [Sulfurovum sp. AR]MDM5263016.1 50S ribosomal protein L25/general stress protein Ctc [Sulfurovum xiamenensis]
MLEGIVRESIGKRNAKQLKRDGYLIANIYANGVENINAAFKRGEFARTVRNKETLAFPVKVGDKEINVFIQEYQLHPVNGDVTHVDLRVAVPGQVTNFLVPVVTHGTPVGLKNKGVLVMSKRRLKVRGTIEDMPAKFDLDVTPLNRDDSILIRDVEVPANCKMMDRPDVAICGVIKAK